MASGEIVSRFLKRKEENLRRVNPNELEAMYGSIFPKKYETSSLVNFIYNTLNKVGFHIILQNGEKEAICTGGEGKSGRGVRIGLRYAATIPGFHVFGSDDTYMPGSTIPKAFEKLKTEGHGKFSYIVASDSGKTSGPKIDMQTISEYQGVPVNLCLITSSYESPMAEIVKKNKGKILILPGRNPQTTVLSNRDYLSEGNQGDLFEIGVTELANLFALGWRKKIKKHDFINFFNEELEQLPERHEQILRLRDSPQYGKLLNLNENPEIDFFSCGQNIDLDAASFNNIRLMHTRSYVADVRRYRKEYEGGIPNNSVHRESSALPIKKNSAVLVISKSFTRKAPDFVGSAREKGAHCFTITKYGKPEYGRVFHIGGDRFYPDTCTFLNCMNLDVLEDMMELMEKDGGVPDHLAITQKKMESYHATDKRSQL